MTMPIRKTFTCPNCRKKLKVDILVSTNTGGGLTTDLHQLALGAEPLIFLIHSCQSCGFTGSPSDFKGKVTSNVTAQIKEHIYPHIKDEHLTADTSWEFAALISEWRQKSPDVIAQQYLNAAWCADNSDKEYYYRRRAADWFEKSLGTGVENPVLIPYLIGELYRRVGELEYSNHWFDTAIAEAEQSEDPENARIKDLAIQQKINPQEMITT